ncbi:MAG: hypothetical protein AB7H86_01930 [Blastocatellales bacterium]
MSDKNSPFQIEPELRWEKLNSTRNEKGWFKIQWEIHRAKVPGGWLVLARIEAGNEHSLTFYPDPNHLWNGGSLT